MLWFWIGFLLLVSFFLALDLGVFHRKNKAVSMREGLIWSAIWAVTAIFFSGFVYLAYDNHWLELGEMTVKAKDGAEQLLSISGLKAWTLFITCYVLEWSLSVDNLFVIALIFAYFKIPAMYQHRVLFWGIIGAIVMRGVFIFLGSELVEKAHWILYVFGGFLIYTAIKMLVVDEEKDPGESRTVRFVYKHFNVTSDLEGAAFTFRKPDETGTMKRFLTPLAIALIVVEVTDLIFAVDSIPAAFGVVREYPDSFLIFTSNIFAILGLRSMYFALSALLGKFRYLKISLAIILAMIGLKMITSEWIKSLHPFLHEHLSLVTLGLVLLLLVGGIVASLIVPGKETHREEEIEEVAKETRMDR